MLILYLVANITLSFFSVSYNLGKRTFLKYCRSVALTREKQRLSNDGRFSLSNLDGSATHPHPKTHTHTTAIHFMQKFTHYGRKKANSHHSGVLTTPTSCPFWIGIGRKDQWKSRTKNYKDQFHRLVSVIMACCSAVTYWLSVILEVVCLPRMSHSVAYFWERLRAQSNLWWQDLLWFTSQMWLQTLKPRVHNNTSANLCVIWPDRSIPCNYRHWSPSRIILTPEFWSSGFPPITMSQQQGKRLVQVSTEVSFMKLLWWRVVIIPLGCCPSVKLGHTTYWGKDFLPSQCHNSRVRDWFRLALR